MPGVVFLFQQGTVGNAHQLKLRASTPHGMPPQHAPVMCRAQSRTSKPQEVRSDDPHRPQSRGWRGPCIRRQKIQQFFIFFLCFFYSLIANIWATGIKSSATVFQARRNKWYRLGSSRQEAHNSLADEASPGSLIRT